MVQQLDRVLQDVQLAPEPIPHVFVGPEIEFHSALLETEVPMHQLPAGEADQQLDHIEQLVFPPTPFVWVGVPKIRHITLQRFTALHTPVLLLQTDPHQRPPHVLTDYQMVQLRTWMRRLSVRRAWPQIHMA